MATEDSLEGLRSRLDGKATARGCAFRLTPENRATIQKFWAVLEANNRNPKTIYSCIYPIALLADGQARNLEDFTSEDVMRFLGSVKRRKITATTEQQYRIKVKVFYKYLLGNWKETPPCVKDVVVTIPKGQRVEKAPSDLLAAAEIESMLKVASPRDAAIVALLANTGIRRKEISLLRVKDLHMAPEGYGTVHVPAGKTGAYDVIVDDALPYLKAWLSQHPARDKDNFNDTSLFVSLSDKSWGRAMDGKSFLPIVKTVARRARLNGKRVYCHLFRSTQATNKAREGWTAEMINLMQGRVQHSQVVHEYVRLAGGDVLNEYRRRRGFTKDKMEAEKAIKTKICWKCGEANPGASLFCYVESCRAPLRGSERFEEITRALDVYHAIKRIHSDPDLRSDLEWLVRRKETKEKASKVL
jgi:site-specific recombinase XerD